MISLDVNAAGSLMFDMHCAHLSLEARPRIVETLTALNVTCERLEAAGMLTVPTAQLVSNNYPTDFKIVGRRKKRKKNDL